MTTFPRRYRQSPLEYALVVGWCTLLGEFVGVHCLVCVGWRELVGVRWSAGGGGGRAVERA